MEDINSNINADLEVRKLQDLVKKLEQQNEQLRSRSALFSSSGTMPGMNGRPLSAGYESPGAATGLPGYGGAKGFGFGALLENSRCLSPRRSYHGSYGGYDTDIAPAASNIGVSSRYHDNMVDYMDEGETSVLDEVEILDLEDMDCLNEDEDSWWVKTEPGKRLWVWAGEKMKFDRPTGWGVWGRNVLSNSVQ